MFNESKEILRWGPQSTEYEYALVGNKAELEGFKNLIAKAIAEGEAFPLLVLLVGLVTSVRVLWVTFT